MFHQVSNSYTSSSLHNQLTFGAASRSLKDSLQEVRDIIAGDWAVLKTYLSTKSADLARSIMIKASSLDDTDEGKLAVAILKNDVDGLKALRESGLHFEDHKTKALLYTCHYSKNPALNLEFLAQVLKDEILTSEILPGSGDTPAHIAAVQGDTETLLFLAANKVDLTKPNLVKNGFSPVAILVVKGHTQTLEKLIEKKSFDVLTAKAPQNYPIAFLAAAQNQPAILQLLGSSGVDLFEKSSSGQTAMEIAEETGSSEAYRFLKGYYQKQKK